MPAERTAILILSIISIIAIIALIINITTTNKNLDKIIYRAKKEAENTLASTGRMIYAEDVENVVGAISIARNENLPENTASTPQGTAVLPKANWNIETVKAISVGNGETIPVPIGFYYVGGDLDTGVIISDNQEDEYDGKTDKTTWEYTTSLKGNQFVWIPCKEEEYKKCDVWNGKTQNSSTLSEGNWDKTTYSSEWPQIIKYNGFYVARYEAGLAETITEFTSTQRSDAINNQVYNKEGIPQAKAGQVPWNFIDWTHAQSNAKRMYNTDSINSGLITGTQWDVMLKAFIGKKKYDGTDLTEQDLINPEKWGNYCNNSIEYTGRMARLFIGNYYYMAAFGGIETSKTSIYSNSGGEYGNLLTTGASRQTEVYHIYDVAGNLQELTEEASAYKATGNYYIARGGSMNMLKNSYPSCYRNHRLQINTQATVGFRVVLYLK